jgi:predicted nucleic acid-binding protein
MSIYWDSQALVAAAFDEAIHTRLQGGVTRTHSLSEVFSTLSGGRLGIRYSPADSARIARSLAERLSFVDLSWQETLRALDEAEGLGVMGGRVHDWLHAVAAKKAGAERLITENVGDFRGFGIAVESP